MAKILFLDDNLARHKLMDERYPGDEIFHAQDLYTFNQMILGEDGWDEIWMDYDLNDFEAKSLLPSGTEATGLDACGFLVRMAIDWTQIKIIIHSSNGNGARTMMKFLTEHGVTAQWKMFDENKDRIKKLELCWEGVEELRDLVDKIQNEDGHDYSKEAATWIATYGIDVVQMYYQRGKCSEH